MPVWDPVRYLQYADQRSRPFFELVARIDADSPRTPGTRFLFQRRDRTSHDADAMLTSRC